MLTASQKMSAHRTRALLDKKRVSSPVVILVGLAFVIFLYLLPTFILPAIDEYRASSNQTHEQQIIQQSRQAFIDNQPKPK